MSDSFLRIIPSSPTYIPAEGVGQALTSLLKRELPNAEGVEIVVNDEVVFVDQGENFERVQCPTCKQTIDTEWWQSALDSASEKQFSDLVVTVPCCSKKLSLNDLEYHWPAGFSRYVVEVREPGQQAPLTAEAVAQIETLLGHAVRQIFTRY